MSDIVDDICQCFQMHFLWGLIDNILALVQEMAWHWTNGKQLSVLMTTQSTDTCMCQVNQEIELMGPCWNDVFIKLWLYYKGYVSGHGTAAVLSPGFSISW